MTRVRGKTTIQLVQTRPKRSRRTIIRWGWVGVSLRKAPRGVHHQLHTRMRPSSFPQIPPKWIEVLSFAHYRRPNTREVHSITYLSTARAPGIAQKHRVHIHHYLCLFHEGPRTSLRLFGSDFTPRNPSPRQLEADSMGYHHVEPQHARRRARARGSPASHTELPRPQGPAQPRSTTLSAP